jgi:hypothetical protein
VSGQHVDDRFEAAGTPGADAVGPDGANDEQPSRSDGALLVDATFGRRIRTLARSGPLYQLARNAAHHEGDWSCYDMLALELAAIDFVMIRMGLASGATREALTGALVDLAAAAAPDRDPAEHRRVATRSSNGFSTTTVPGSPPTQTSLAGRPG